METGALFVFAGIVAARERVWIASPYHVPDTDILTVLKHAALAARDLRILVPEMIDHQFPWRAACAYFDDQRDSGAAPGALALISHHSFADVPRRPVSMSATDFPKPSKAEVTAVSISASGSAPSAVTAAVNSASCISAPAIRASSVEVSMPRAMLGVARSVRAAAISLDKVVMSVRNGKTALAASPICSETRSAADSAPQTSQRQSAVRIKVAFRNASTRFLILRPKLRSAICCTTEL